MQNHAANLDAGQGLYVKDKTAELKKSVFSTNLGF